MHDHRIPAGAQAIVCIDCDYRLWAPLDTLLRGDFPVCPLCGDDMELDSAEVEGPEDSFPFFHCRVCRQWLAADDDDECIDRETCDRCARGNWEKAILDAEREIERMLSRAEVKGAKMTPRTRNAIQRRRDWIAELEELISALV